MTSPINSDYPEMRIKTALDFLFGKVIRYGTFSYIYLARDIETNKEFAVKVLQKAHVIRENRAEHALRECEVLRVLGNSSKYFVHLYSAIQDPEKLYFVLTYATNGDLLKYINLHRKLTIECSRYYSAELVLALEYLHSKKIVHRDLTPKKILLDNNFHILIAGFDNAKIENDNQNQTNGDTEQSINETCLQINSFVGTAQFLSPEMLRETKSSYSSDLWAFGCIVFQMASGQMPFFDVNKYTTFQKIVRLAYKFPEDFDVRLKDFVEKLLVLEPSKRLGATDKVLYTSLRGHFIFDGVNWSDLGPPPKPCGSEIIPSRNDSVSGTFQDKQPDLHSKKTSKLALEKILPVSSSISQVTRKQFKETIKITDISQEEIEYRLRRQKYNAYNVFVEGNLILMQGFILKGKGLFRRRRRMFLLTLGPHLYYVDPTTMKFKGEIPWGSDIKTEGKNVKTFFIHTPNRKYHLKAPDGYAWGWIRAIEQVKEYYYPDCNIGNN